MPMNRIQYQKGLSVPTSSNATVVSRVVAALEIARWQMDLLTLPRSDGPDCGYVMPRRRARCYREMQNLKLKILLIKIENTPSFLYHHPPNVSSMRDIFSVGKP